MTNVNDITSSTQTPSNIDQKKAVQQDCKKGAQEHKKTKRKSDTHDTATGHTQSSVKLIDGEA